MKAAANGATSGGLRRLGGRPEEGAHGVLDPHGELRGGEVEEPCSYALYPHGDEQGEGCLRQSAGTVPGEACVFEKTDASCLAAWPDALRGAMQFCKKDFERKHKEALEYNGNLLAAEDGGDEADAVNDEDQDAGRRRRSRSRSTVIMKGYCSSGSEEH